MSRRACCNACGKEMKLRKDGRIRRHYNKTLGWDCSGSLMRPAPPSTKESPDENGK